MAKSLERDFVKIAKEYAQAAIKDKKRKKFGHYVRLAAQRFLNDLKRARRRDCDFIFDPWHACDPCEFIEQLPHVEGTWDSPKIILHPSHVFFVVQLFGFRKRKAINIAGYGKFHQRRYTSALFAVARKNAKSTLAGGVMLYCECCEPEEGAQVISAATTFPQASIIFNIAKRMVELTADLRSAFGLEVWAKSISRFETGSSFKPIHAKASTQDGLNPSHICLDEIHAHKSADLVNVLTSAAGARSNPLWLYTTTEGYENTGPWGELRDFAKNLLEGIFGTDADHFLVLYFAVDEENKDLGIKADDDFDQKAWQKANPLIDVNPYILQELKKAAVEAKQMPSKLAEFRIKRLNRQAVGAKGWINLSKWLRCNRAVDLEFLKPHPCWGGLDLSSTSDLAVFRLVWKVEKIIYTHGWRFCPHGAVQHRSERGTSLYPSWVSSGQLIEIEGDTIDYAVIEKTIIEQCAHFNVQMIGYDRWNAIDLVNRLVAKGIPLTEFVQVAKSYHPAMQALELAYIAGDFAHGGDKILAWCAANIVPRFDQNMNMAPDKKRSKEKIDDITALLEAIGVMQASPAKRPSIYSLGVL